MRDGREELDDGSGEVRSSFALCLTNSFFQEAGIELRTMSIVDGNFGEKINDALSVGLDTDALF